MNQNKLSLSSELKLVSNIGDAPLESDKGTRNVLVPPKEPHADSPRAGMGTTLTTCSTLLHGLGLQVGVPRIRVQVVGCFLRGYADEWVQVPQEATCVGQAYI